MSSKQIDHSTQLLAKLSSQIDNLLSYDDKAPQIEIDIIKENIRTLYDIIDNFNNTTFAVVTNQNIEDIDKEINDLLDIAESEFNNEEEKIEEQIAEQEIVLEEQYIDDKQEPEIPKEEEINRIHDELVEDKKKADAKVKADEIAYRKEIEERVRKQLDKEKEAELAKQKAIEDKVVQQLAKEKEEAIQKAKDVEIAKQKIIDEKVAQQLAKEKEDEAAKQKAIEEKAKEASKPTNIYGEPKKTVHVLDVLPEDELEEDSNAAPLMPSTIKLKPIKSLKNGIGINDKFMIINDLFEGRTKNFNKAINKLDTLTDTQEALFLLGDMKDENLWEAQDAVFKSFKMYVERRYAK